MNAFTKNLLSSALGSLIGVMAALFFFLVIIPVFIAMIFSGAKGSKAEPIEKNSALHLDIRGRIVEKKTPLDFDFLGGGGVFSEDHTVGLYELNRAIDLAKDDKRILGIYLELHDFSAGWATVTSLRRHLQDFAASGKWVQVYASRMDELGYYLASAGTEVTLEPWGDLEFNGLAVQEAFLKGLLEKLELEPKVFRVGKFKAAIEPLIRDQMSDENREQTQTLVKDLWSSVRAAAAQIAKIEEPKVDELANNFTIVSAEAAKSAGLVHNLAFQDEVEDRIRGLTFFGKDDDLPLVTPSQMLKQGKKKKSGNKIAVIFAEGEIHNGMSTRDSIGAVSLRQDILDAKADEDVQAIVIRINSPGGDALASDVIWREVRKSDDEIPIVISMGDMAASGGYYIASGGRYIFAEPTTITGSIGVFGILFNAEKFFKNKTGVSFDRAMTHQYADIGSMSRPMKEFETQVIQSQVERTYKRFLDVVQDGRDFENRKDLEGIAEGRVWSGIRAKELGLVDEIGGLEQAVAKAAEYAEIKDYDVEVFPADVDPLRKIFDKLSGEAIEAAFGSSAKQMKQVSKIFDPLKDGIYARVPFDLKIR